MLQEARSLSTVIAVKGFEDGCHNRHIYSLRNLILTEQGIPIPFGENGGQDVTNFSRLQSGERDPMRPSGFPQPTPPA
jgi:hypothetical protein